MFIQRCRLLILQNWMNFCWRYAINGSYDGTVLKFIHFTKIQLYTTSNLSDQIHIWYLLLQQVYQRNKIVIYCSSAIYGLDRELHTFPSYINQRIKKWSFLLPVKFYLRTSRFVDKAKYVDQTIKDSLWYNHLYYWVFFSLFRKLLKLDNYFEIFSAVRIETGEYSVIAEHDRQNGRLPVTCLYVRDYENAW